MGKRKRSTGAGTPKSSPLTRRKARAAKTVWIWIGAGVLATLVVLVLLLRPTTRVPAEITASQAYEELQSGAYFLDVRGAADWNSGHIPGSALIPLDELAGRLGEVPTDREIVVVCTMGVRSAEGGRILVEAGFWPVACLGGGLREWAAAGYPLEKSVP